MGSKIEKKKKKYLLFEGGTLEEIPEYFQNTEYLGRLNEGSYFGEISLITNLKWTTTVKTIDYATIAFM